MRRTDSAHALRSQTAPSNGSVTGHVGGWAALTATTLALLVAPALTLATTVLAASGGLTLRTIRRRRPAGTDPPGSERAEANGRSHHTAD